MRFGARFRRRLPLGLGWPLMAEAVGIANTRLLEVRPTALGFALELELDAPTTFEDVERKATTIASAYGIARARVIRAPLRADRATVLLDRQLWLGEVTYPGERNPAELPLNPQRAIPIGIDDDGGQVTIELAGKCALVGGSPGSGKSVGLRNFLAGLAASRDVRLVGVDPKHAELVMWSARFDELVLGNEPAPVCDLLTGLLDEIQFRAKVMASTGSAQLPPTSENPMIVLVIDEWAELAAAGDAKERSKVAGLLRRYLSLGRAVGCTAILCTQRPTSDTVDVGTRALIGHRFALRCGDRHQAESILGVGTFEPAQLLGAMPGRALWSDGGPAKAVQFYNVPDQLVPSLVCSGLRPSGRATGRPATSGREVTQQLRLFEV